MIRCLTLPFQAGTKQKEGSQAGTKQKEGSPTKGALGAGKAYHCTGEFTLYPGQHKQRLKNWMQGQPLHR